MDVQAVLNAVAKTAARLCDAKDALIWQVEGDRLSAGGQARLPPDDLYSQSAHTH